VFVCVCSKRRTVSASSVFVTLAARSMDDEKSSWRNAVLTLFLTVGLQLPSFDE